MIVGFQFLAVSCCILFAGAAIYINLVEHPARMSCDTKTAATVWAPSYKRATVMQAPLAIMSFLAGVGAWLFGGGTLWLIGAVLIGLVVPFTFIAVMPRGAICHQPKRDRCLRSGGVCTLCGVCLVFWPRSCIWCLYSRANNRASDHKQV
jgi:Domain of unknown function (DUF1772)